MALCKRSDFPENHDISSEARILTKDNGYIYILFIEYKIKKSVLKKGLR